MITRQKAVIMIAGNKERREVILEVLRNHEALVQIFDFSSIENVWDKNKTPMVDESDFVQVCSSYEGSVLIFNVDLLAETNQPFVSEQFTKYCYKRKIEPGEFKVPNTANNSAQDCIFCNITKHVGKTTHEHNLSSKTVDMIVYESPNFVVVPGVGPLAPGYLMIMTKEHYLSLAQLPEDLMVEYLEVEEDMKKILTDMYSMEVGFYEHGTGPHGAVGLKSIVHMHVHIMLDNVLSDFYKKMMSMKEISDITIAKNESYFWAKSGTSGKQWIVYDPEVYIPRQIHRQIYAEEHSFSKDQFNWRKTEFAEMTERNVWQLFNYLKDVEDPRIKARTAEFVSAGNIKFE